GAGENLGQNIFHRPASSGRYAVNVNFDLFKVGGSVTTLEYVLDEKKRRGGTGVLLTSIVNTFLKRAGAHRNTQNPHIVEFQGVVTTSTSSVPAPVFSALNDRYETEIRQIAEVLNRPEIGNASIRTYPFQGLAAFAAVIADRIADA